MNAPPQLGLNFTLLCFLVFAIFWCCILAFVSYVGGWHSLAKTHRAEDFKFRIAERDVAKTFWFASMTMGPKWFPTNYGSCLTIWVSRGGIGIKVWPLFRIMHPPLLIAWQDVERCVRERALWLFSVTAVYLKDQELPLRFSGRAGRAIHDVWLQQADRVTTVAITAS